MLTYSSNAKANGEENSANKANGEENSIVSYVRASAVERGISQCVMITFTFALTLTYTVLLLLRTRR